VVSSGKDAVSRWNEDRVLIRGCPEDIHEEKVKGQPGK
jgi:hypothetical protein